MVRLRTRFRAYSVFTSDRPVDGRQHYDHRADVNIKEYGNASAVGA